MKPELKRQGLALLAAAIGLYVLYATLDALQDANRRNRAISVVFWIMIGFGIGGFWMYRHLTCPTCQQRTAALRRKLGMVILPND